MKKRNIGIVSLIILLFVAFLNYDEGNKNKRSSIYKHALQIQDALQEEEKLLERLYNLKSRLDLVITKTASSKDTNEEYQQMYDTAIRDGKEVSDRLEKIESMGEKMVDEYNNFIEEYNRTNRPILFRNKELPAKMVTYEKPNLPNSADAK